MSTIDSRLRSFQIKILHNILYTNDQLHRWKIVPSDLCSFCQSERETFDHFLLTCQKSSEFWENVANIAIFRQNEIRDFTDRDKIIGIQFEDMSSPNAIIVNHVILLAKQYLFVCKRNNKVPNIVSFSAYVRYVEKIEKMIATKNNKINKHGEKWSTLLSSL